MHAFYSADKGIKHGPPALKNEFTLLRKCCADRILQESFQFFFTTRFADGDFELVLKAKNWG